MALPSPQIPPAAPTTHGVFAFDFLLRVPSFFGRPGVCPTEVQSANAHFGRFLSPPTPFPGKFWQALPSPATVPEAALPQHCTELPAAKGSHPQNAAAPVPPARKGFTRDSSLLRNAPSRSRKHRLNNHDQFGWPDKLHMHVALPASSLALTPRSCTCTTALSGTARSFFKVLPIDGSKARQQGASDSGCCACSWERASLEGATHSKLFRLPPNVLGPHEEFLCPVFGRLEGGKGLPPSHRQRTHTESTGICRPQAL